MKPIIKILFGSHLYGTNTPTSDRDYKGVFIPEARDIILGKAARTVNNSTNTSHEKNSTMDVDMEWFSLDEYLKQLCQGQTFALDMLFAPEDCWIADGISPYDRQIWERLLTYKDEFIHKGILSFVGYCQAQAAKYGIKGSRMAALKTAINFLKELNPDDRLNDHWDAIIELTQKTEHMAIVKTEGTRKGSAPLVLDNWEVSNRKMTKTVRVEYALNIYQMIYNRYGERAKLAEKNEGIDWKALSHAVRVCYEADELLRTGKITFPCPRARILLDIKQGKLSYKEVSSLIETGLKSVEKSKQLSTLREKPNHKFREEFIHDVYLKEILSDLKK